MKRKTEVFGDLKAGDLVVRNATDSIRPGAFLEAHEIRIDPTHDASLIPA